MACVFNRISSENVLYALYDQSITNEPLNEISSSDYTSFCDSLYSVGGCLVLKNGRLFYVAPYNIISNSSDKMLDQQEQMLIVLFGFDCA